MLRATALLTPAPELEVVTALRDAPGRARALVHALGDGAASPGPDGRWTPIRIVVHLAAVDEAVWLTRLRQLAAHAHPTWTWTEPDLGDQPDPPPSRALAAFDRSRRVLLDAVDALDAAAWRATGIHATFGELDVAGLLHEVLRHDAEHLASLDAAVRAAGVAASGEQPE